MGLSLGSGHREPYARAGMTAAPWWGHNMYMSPQRPSCRKPWVMLCSAWSGRNHPRAEEFRMNSSKAVNKWLVIKKAASKRRVCCVWPPGKLVGGPGSLDRALWGIYSGPSPAKLGLVEPRLGTLHGIVSVG